MQKKYINSLNLEQQKQRKIKTMFGVRSTEYEYDCLSLIHIFVLIQFDINIKEYQEYLDKII